MNKLYTVLVLSALLAVSLATTCYECGIEDTTCNDGDSAYTAPSDHETDCSASILSADEDGGCSKLKIRVKVFGVWGEAIDRSCGQEYDNSYCKEGDKIKINIFGIKTHTWGCSCEGNKCNSGSQVALSVSLLIASAAAKYLL